MQFRSLVAHRLPSLHPTATHCLTRHCCSTTLPQLTTLPAKRAMSSEPPFSAAPSPTRAPLDYRNKLILAPMVRIGTLPTRLQALRYGADLVYGEEIIDHKMLLTRRLFNTQLGCIDFVEPDGSVLFRTCDEEKGRVVFQMGTSDPDRAVAVAEMVANDVVAVDVNMGCPKPFSMQGGMGAALLANPDKIRAILTALVQAVGHKVHVTCKIRVLPTVEETIGLVKLIEATGVSAIAIHSRLTHERPREPGHPEMIRRVAEAVALPVIANGGSLCISSFADIDAFKTLTGCSSVMVARAAQWDLSVFRSEGCLPRLQVIQNYLRCALEWDNGFGNTKFCVQHLLTNSGLPFASSITMANTLEEMFQISGLSLEEMSAIKERRDARAANLLETLAQQRHGWRGEAGAVSGSPVGPTKRRYSNESIEMHAAAGDTKRARAESEEALLDPDTFESPVRFKWKSVGKNNKFPKAILTEYLRDVGKEATCTVEELNHTFKATITVDGKRYISSHWEKRKKDSEHASAIVYLLRHAPKLIPQEYYELESDRYQFVEEVLIPGKPTQGSAAVTTRLSPGPSPAPVP